MKQYWLHDGPVFCRPDENWGWNSTTYDEMCHGMCYNSTTGFKFWGLISISVDVEKLLFHSQLHTLKKRGYKWVTPACHEDDSWKSTTTTLRAYPLHLLRTSIYSMSP
jgi:hypothetical protein